MLFFGNETKNNSETKSETDSQRAKRERNMPLMRKQIDTHSRINSGFVFESRQRAKNENQHKLAPHHHDEFRRRVRERKIRIIYYHFESNSSDIFFDFDQREKRHAAAAAAANLSCLCLAAKKKQYLMCILKRLEWLVQWVYVLFYTLHSQALAAVTAASRYILYINIKICTTFQLFLCVDIIVRRRRHFSLLPVSFVSATVALLTYTLDDHLPISSDDHGTVPNRNHQPTDTSFSFNIWHWGVSLLLLLSNNLKLRSRVIPLTHTINYLLYLLGNWNQRRGHCMPSPSP